MSESPRRQVREIVLQALYAVETGDKGPEESYDSLIAGVKLSDDNIKFGRRMIRMATENRVWAEEQISALAANWKLERIATVDLTIMRLGLVEIEFMVDTPVAVAINEAVELAKKYSTEKSASFVNGILDAFAKRQEKAPKME